MRRADSKVTTGMAFELLNGVYLRTRNALMLGSVHRVALTRVNGLGSSYFSFFTQQERQNGIQLLGLIMQKIASHRIKTEYSVMQFR